MQLIVDHRWRVNASHSFELPLPATTVWGQMRDIRRFITLDPLHKHAHFGDRSTKSAMPRQGDALVLEHRLLGIGPDRVGRLLRWSEGSGYAISDLSRRGPRVGFPHVCMYEVQPLDEHKSQLTVAARGRWTATWLPRWMIRCWLWWILRSTALRIERELLCLALHLRKRATV